MNGAEHALGDNGCEWSAAGGKGGGRNALEKAVTLMGLLKIIYSCHSGGGQKNKDWGHWGVTYSGSLRILDRSHWGEDQHSGDALIGLGG